MEQWGKKEERGATNKRNNGGWEIVAELVPGGELLLCVTGCSVARLADPLTRSTSSQRGSRSCILNLPKLALPPVTKSSSHVFVEEGDQ